MKWNVYGPDDSFLAVIEAESEADAMKKALELSMESVRVELSNEHPGKDV